MIKEIIPELEPSFLKNSENPRIPKPQKCWRKEAEKEKGKEKKRGKRSNGEVNKMMRI